MNPTIKSLDARGLACPEPVIRTRKALAEGGFDLLEVLVDQPAARENVVRFATYAHCTVDPVQEEGPVSRIRIHPPQGGVPVEDRILADPGACEIDPSGAQGATVFIRSAGLGLGDDQLAGLLMKAFLFALTESDGLPRRIILMNGGVRLAVPGSECLDHLRKLGELGVEILACGTCLEFYHLKDSLAVGRVSNMYEIAGCLLEGRTLTV